MENTLSAIVSGRAMARAQKSIANSSFAIWHCALWNRMALWHEFFGCRSGWVGAAVWGLQNIDYQLGATTPRDSPYAA